MWNQMAWVPYLSSIFLIGLEWKLAKLFLQLFLSQASVRGSLWGGFEGWGMKRGGGYLGTKVILWPCSQAKEVLWRMAWRHGGGIYTLYLVQCIHYIHALFSTYSICTVYLLIHSLVSKFKVRLQILFQTEACTQFISRGPTINLFYGYLFR